MSTTMAKTERVSLRATENDRDAWQAAADAELRKLSDWCELVLNSVADSGVTVMELRDLLNNATEGKRK